MVGVRETFSWRERESDGNRAGDGESLRVRAHALEKGSQGMEERRSENGVGRYKGMDETKLPLTNKLQ